MKVVLGIVVLVLVIAGAVAVVDAQGTWGPGNLHNQLQGVDPVGPQDAEESPRPVTPQLSAEPPVPGPTRNLPGVDRRFLTRAITQSDRVEALSRMMLDHDVSNEVKGLAQSVMESHMLIGGRLRTIASQGRVPLREPVLPTPEMKRLARLQGERLEREYLETVIRAHRRAAASFQRHITAARDPDVRHVAAMSLPILQTNLSEAIRLRNQVRREGAGG
ncbi:MAG: DUF4142 domain-containing protein [Myxococcota bacterium]